MWEEVVRIEGEQQIPAGFFHCEEEAIRVPGAPMIKFVEPHFNRPLGQFVTDAQDLERKQRAQGIYTPSANEVEDALNTDPIKMLKPKANKKAILASAEKTWSHLHNEHKVEEFRSS